MTDYPQALWIPNDNFFPDSGKKTDIVIHGTAGGTSAIGIASYFKSTEGTTNPVSSHYIVDQDGKIVQTVLEKDGAWGNGEVTNPAYDKVNPNMYTISIEHVKSSIDNSNQLTQAQQDASFKLIKDICLRNNIPASNIIPHALIDPVNRKLCPNTFPWDLMHQYLEADDMFNEMSTDFPTYFTSVNSNQWKCKKNGFVVQYGIKGAYQKLCIDGQSLPLIGLPVSSELYATKNNVSIVIQFFERGTLVYDPLHTLDSQPGMTDTYMPHVDDPFIKDVKAKNGVVQ